MSDQKIKPIKDQDRLPVKASASDTPLGASSIDIMLWKMDVYQQLLDGELDDKPKIKNVIVGDKDSGGLITKEDIAFFDTARVAAPTTWIKTIQVGRTVANLGDRYFNEGKRLGADHPSLKGVGEAIDAGNRSRISSASELLSAVESLTVTPEEADSLN